MSDDNVQDNMQLAAIAKQVLRMARRWISPSSRAALKLGQQVHRSTVPAQHENHTYLLMLDKDVSYTLSLPCFSVQIKHNICKNMNIVQQQCEYHHQKVLIQSFHLSGHTFKFRWTFQDFEVFLVQSNSPLAVKGLKILEKITVSSNRRAVTSM